MIELVDNLVIAVALGALIGLEREFSQIKHRYYKYGGIRTFPLISLLGAISAYFSSVYSVWIIIIAFASLALLIGTSHYLGGSKHTGITTEIAGLLTFWIGALSYNERNILAIFLAIFITLILYERVVLHKFVSKIKSEELYSTIKFAIIAFVILPVLPDKPMGPFGFFNPYDVWLIVVLVSGISFLGYVLCKLLRKNGREISGFLGGFVSSTATTISVLQSKNPSIKSIVTANSAMMIKVLIIIAVVNFKFFSQAALPIVFMIIASSIIVFFAKVKSNVDIKIGSPFSLWPALSFALIFSIALFAIKAASIYLSSSGIYGMAFVTGLFDADSVVLSAITGNINNAGIIGVIAVVANTISKGALTIIINRKIAWKLVPLLGIVAAAGIFSLIFLV